MSRPSRAEMLACLATGIALLALIWSSSRESAAPLASQTKDSLPRELAATAASLLTLSEGAAQLVETAAKSVVRVDVTLDARLAQSNELETYFGRLPQETIGSGIVLDTDLVLTNYHVVRLSDSITVSGQGAPKRPATLLGFDPLTDLAVLKVANLTLPALKWGDSDEVASGHLVWAIGSPYGLDQSVSMGVVSSTNRPTLLDSPFQDFLQSDVSINPGNSGGPLIDAQGAVIGINTAIAGDSFAGISFALPSNTAKSVFKQLQQHGEMPRGWLGFQLSNVTRSRAAVAGLDSLQGAYVESLVSEGESPAKQAGILVGDICVSFNGWEVTGPLGLIRQIASTPIDTTVKLRVWRRGQELELDVHVLPRP